MSKCYYESPFNSRYSSNDMISLFSPDTKFKTWRKLWVALAECEKELGIDISEDQINQLKAHIDSIDYDEVEKIEKVVKHDVMAHIHAYGKQCPDARGIIHLGATSCFVTDNADILIMKNALKIIKSKLALVIKILSDFALKYKNLPTLGLTHCQPAQLVTVGKRACLWIQDLLMDLQDIEYIESTIKLLGSKGTTGTQASFLNLFEHDHQKVIRLEMMMAKKMGVEKVVSVSGQTYTRKIDSRIINLLSGIAQSAYKFSNDIRLLQSMGEMEEPFESEQVGSSAMAYKRNPIRSERIASLARYIIINALNPAMTAANQWFERTLDDSANRRISISEAFLATDAVLNIYLNVSSGLIVYPNVIGKHVLEQLPFIATENILMEAVKNGGDRQELHERIRVHSMEANKNIKEHSAANDLIDRISKDNMLSISLDKLKELLNPINFIGRSEQQVDDFVIGDVMPVLKKFDVDDHMNGIEFKLRV